MAIPKIPSYPMPAQLPANRVTWQFEPHRAALLVHDMQDYFLDFYDRGAAPVPALLANARRLIDFARTAGMPIYYTAQSAMQTPAQRALLTDMWGPGLTGFFEDQRTSLEASGNISGAQERTRSHERDPGCACKRSLSSPRAKRAGALLPGLKMKKAG